MFTWAQIFTLKGKRYKAYKQMLASKMMQVETEKLDDARAKILR